MMGKRYANRRTVGVRYDTATNDQAWYVPSRFARASDAMVKQPQKNQKSCDRGVYKGSIACSVEYGRNAMIDELYGAVTVIAQLQHHGTWHSNVELEWIYCDRAQPIAPYVSLIADYDELDQPERRYAEQYMEALFTKAEYRTLRRYLKDYHNLVADMSVVPIPMNVRPGSVGFIATPAQRMLEVDESGNFGWYRLQSAVEMLPFKVAAWYVVENNR